ncbi:flagellar protein FlgN [Domibacillus sp. A3M-37]|uniref:flagellar protein FlgN n=1 Tax=Domibacillus sp. A3M-37 TaxID=2962037 RepID=UPI0020B6EEF6|nr:flagellar protein FlgN [Domibacillus sp. A3M-37]MCP3761236.1 flagellar protein FlgN [Domibacillus sp. A3M-37]
MLIIETLEKQLALHKSLLGLAYAKTEAVKQNKMDELNRIIRDEQKHISAISILEKQRASQSDGTIMDQLSQLPEEEQEHAAHLRDGLMSVLLELKRVNDLNAELLDQSLQFVHLQLDLLAPPDAGNYAPEGDQNEPSSGPVFDSKA